MSNTTSNLKSALDQLYQTNDRAGIDRFFTEKTLQYLPDCCSISDEYIFLMNEAGSYYRGISEYEKAISFFINLIHEMDRFGMGKTSEYATVLNNLAGSYRMFGDYQNAEAYFLQSIALYDSLGLQNTFEYASALNNLSLCYQATQKYEKALEVQKQAIKCLGNQEMPDSLSLATSYSNVANIYYALHMEDEAFKSIKRSIDLFKESKHTDNSSYIGAIHTRAYFHFMQGDYAKALKDYQNVMECTEKLFGKNADYSTAARNAAITCQKLNLLHDALPYIESAAALDMQFFGKDSPRYANTKLILERLKKEAGVQ
jgi:tetratricopeptide (TPR) repeat protein